MSFLARLLLGSVAAILGGLMIFIAPNDDVRIGFYVFGAFCVCIGAACATSGRVQALFGSIVAACVLSAGVAYLVHQVLHGSLLPVNLASPSVLTAFLFNLLFGLPSAMFLSKLRFGFSRRPEG